VARRVSGLSFGRGDLSRAECLALFRQISRDEQPELQQGALLGALAAKGETPEEVAGVWQAVDDLDTRHVELDGDGPLVENCGIGMGRLKTFNISSAAAVVAAAGGVRMARHGSRGLTSACGTVDLLEADRFLHVLAGTGSAAGTGITCLNAGATLQVAGWAGDLAAGVERSRELLQSGRAFATLCRWVRIQGGADGRALERLRQRARRLGLEDKVPL
jgi:anthranilate phosphoribosyltransferase